MQGRRRPFPAGPRRANKQRARARTRSPIDPNPDAPDGRHERRRRARVPSFAGHAGQASHSSWLPGQGSRSGCGASPTERAGQGPWRGACGFAEPARPDSRVPVLPRPRTLRAYLFRARPPASRQSDPAWKCPPARPFGRARWAAGASPVSRGICGRPWGGPIPARSSSSPVNRPYGRVIAHPALPDVGGPGIAPLRYQESNGAVCSDPSRRRPRPGFQAMTRWAGTSMRLARRRRKPGSIGVGGRGGAVSRTLAPPRFVPSGSRPWGRAFVKVCSCFVFIPAHLPRGDCSGGGALSGLSNRHHRGRNTGAPHPFP
jgi:hypothetical protein